MGRLHTLQQFFVLVVDGLLDAFAVLEGIENSDAAKQGPAKDQKSIEWISCIGSLNAAARAHVALLRGCKRVI